MAYRLLFAKWQQLTNIWRDSIKRATQQGALLTKNKMLRYECKIVNTEVDVDKTVGLLFRQKRGGDKMVSSFVQDTTEFTVFLSQREMHRPHFSNTI